jgi:hypothetical protein
MSNIFAKAMRAMAVQELEAYALDFQLGGRPHRTIDSANLHTRLAADWAARRKRPMALLFLDLRAAFYRVSRVRALEAMQQAGVPNRMIELISEWHQNCWYVVNGSDREFYLRDGVRPGDPVADLFFNYAFRALLSDVNAQFAIEKLAPTIAKGSSSGCWDEQSVGVVPLLGPTWVDDHVVMIEHEESQGMLGKLRRAMDIFDSVAKTHGMQVNYGEGKTEAIVWWRGRGAYEAQKTLRVEDETLVLPVLGGECAPSCKSLQACRHHHFLCRGAHQGGCQKAQRGQGNHLQHGPPYFGCARITPEAPFGRADCHY